MLLWANVSFESTISWFPYVLSLAAILFAFSTMIAWSYYGLKAWEYIFGDTKISGLIYKGLFLCFLSPSPSTDCTPLLVRLLVRFQYANEYSRTHIVHTCYCHHDGGGAQEAQHPALLRPVQLRRNVQRDGPDSGHRADPGAR